MKLKKKLTSALGHRTQLMQAGCHEMDLVTKLLRKRPLEKLKAFLFQEL